MAIKPIEEMIKPVSRRDDVLEKLKANDPDKELRDKGILPPLSRRRETQVASEMSPYDFSGWYEMYTDMQSRGELPDWMDSFDEGPNSFMKNLDVLDISPWDFVQRKGKKGTQMAMSDPDPYEGYDDIFEKGALEIFGKPLRSLTNDQYEELEERIRDMLDADIPYAAKGGIIGLRFGGDLKTELEQIHNPAENGQQGIMQLASASGNDKILSAMMWAATLPEFGSLEAVLDSLDAGETDINGLVNAYEDAIVDMN
jgi:hypothetical protein